jgi:hypothetical protein
LPLGSELEERSAGKESSTYADYPHTRTDRRRRYVIGFEHGIEHEEEARLNKLDRKAYADEGDKASHRKSMIVIEKSFAKLSFPVHADS